MASYFLPPPPLPPQQALAAFIHSLVQLQQQNFPKWGYRSTASGFARGNSQNAPVKYAVALLIPFFDEIRRHMAAVTVLQAMLRQESAFYSWPEIELELGMITVKWTAADAREGP